MSEQPFVMELAGRLEAGWGVDALEVAAELRRLHTENENLLNALRMEEAISFRLDMQQYAAQCEAQQTLLRQALEALEVAPYMSNKDDHEHHQKAITAIRQHLENKE